MLQLRGTLRRREDKVVVVDTTRVLGKVEVVVLTTSVYLPSFGRAPLGVRAIGANVGDHKVQLHAHEVHVTVGVAAVGALADEASLRTGVATQGRGAHAGRADTRLPAPAAADLLAAAAVDRCTIAGAASSVPAAVHWLANSICALPSASGASFRKLILHGLRRSYHCIVKALDQDRSVDSTAGGDTKAILGGRGRVLVTRASSPSIQCCYAMSRGIAAKPTFRRHWKKGNGAHQESAGRQCWLLHGSGNGAQAAGAK